MRQEPCRGVLAAATATVDRAARVMLTLAPATFRQASDGRTNASRSMIYIATIALALV